jgi:hypothetical protein
MHLLRDADRCSCPTELLRCQMLSSVIDIAQPLLRVGRALFTGDKEASMLVSITQLLGIPDWGQTVKGEGPKRFVHTAAKDLKQCAFDHSCFL